MHRVFVSDDCMADGRIVIKGDQAHHISRSLRMKKSEKITVVVNGTAYDCTLSGFTGETVTAEIVAPAAKTCEPPSRITLFQAITKSDSDSIVRRPQRGLPPCVSAWSSRLRTIASNAGRPTPRRSIICG